MSATPAPVAPYAARAHEARAWLRIARMIRLGELAGVTPGGRPDPHAAALAIAAEAREAALRIAARERDPLAGWSGAAAARAIWAGGDLETYL